MIEIISRKKSANFSFIKVHHMDAIFHIYIYTHTHTSRGVMDPSGPSLLECIISNVQEDTFEIVK